jgi:hypothetical protein
MLLNALFNYRDIVHFVGSSHFSVPCKYKFFTPIIHNFDNNNNNVFPGDFSKAFNGLFSIGG